MRWMNPIHYRPEWVTTAIRNAGKLSCKKRPFLLRQSPHFYSCYFLQFARLFHELILSLNFT